MKYAYSKPKLDNSNIKSYIDCKGDRHPIIENIIGFKYVPNDVILGKNDFDGMLLFGTNASGNMFNEINRASCNNGSSRFICSM